LVSLGADRERGETGSVVESIKKVDRRLSTPGERVVWGSGS